MYIPRTSPNFAPILQTIARGGALRASAAVLTAPQCSRYTLALLYRQGRDGIGRYVRGQTRTREVRDNGPDKIRVCQLLFATD